MKNIEQGLKAIGMGVCLAFLIPSSLSLFYQLLFAGIVMLSVGIPHGAIDHLIHNPNPTRSGFFRFLLSYLVLIGLYCLLWFLTPIIALIAFLGMSAYHFGQSHFLDQLQVRPWDSLLFISRGAFFLAANLLGDFELTQYILAPLVQLEIGFESRLITVIFLGFFTLLNQAVLKIHFSRIHVLEVVLLGSLLFISPLFVGFVVYFGFWHATPSMLKEYAFLSRFPKYQGWKKFSLQLIPFTLISLLGISGILIYGINFMKEQEVFLLFFILISLISFPHIIYMDRFLKKDAQY